MPRRTLDNDNSNTEFYTQYEDVEREMLAYYDYNDKVFLGKTILCPCNDPDWSSFTKYFAQNFIKLGLKKLICTSYANTNMSNDDILISNIEINSAKYDSEKSKKCGKKFVLENKDNSENIGIENMQWEYLEGDGDFRSEEITKLRNESDIIITNPPFNLFRDFISWIFEANKKFIILGNQNAIAYKEFFPYIMDNKVWLGSRFNERVNGKNLTYMVPKSFEMNASEMYVDEKGNKFVTVPGTGWFTNLDYGKRHQPLQLMTMAENLKFSKHKIVKEIGYLKYDNYDGIDIPFVDAIPSDYEGYMGVPLTFLGKYCPEQFEIVKFRKGDDGKDLSVNGKCPYFRIIIRRKQ